MNLIYINEIGADFKGQKQYEFIFSKSVEFDIENWFIVPASSTTQSLSPDIEYIDMVGLLKDTNVNLELIQNSDYFGVIDAVDGVISLGWEKYNQDSDDARLTFKFGETFESVTKKLKFKGYNLLNQEIKAQDYGA
jgi:hypothetical protein